MPKDQSESELLIEEGRKQLFVSSALLGIVLLFLLAFAGLQYAGTLQLERYFLPDRPEAVDQRLLYVSLAMTGLLVSLFVGSWIVQALGRIRQGKKLQQQAELNSSKGPSAGSSVE
jgi:hypothetical protein